MREIYLDNSATTKCYPEVVELVSSLMSTHYGNPSSMHTKGVEAEQFIKRSKEVIAGILKVTEKELVFTSGGTESDNLAVIGTAMANCRTGKHLITTQIEHPAVKEAMRYLEDTGFRVTYLPVDKYGVISLADLEEAITEETILISVMHVNNEIGSVQPIEEIGKLIKKRKPSVLFHVDAVQSFGKYAIYPKRLNIDLLSVSGHKIHGPKGSGLLYIADKVKIKPILFGGGHQRGLRSGTENVPGTAGLGLASKLCYINLDETIKRLYDLKYYFLEQVLTIPELYVNGIALEQGLTYDVLKATAPHIISLSIPGIRSEVLLHALEGKGIYVSAGSACASNKPAVSTTLTAIGLKKAMLESTVRISLSCFNTKEELRDTVQVLKDLLPVLRKYTRH